MSKIIGRAHPERGHIQPLRFEELSSEAGEVPFVVSVHEKYKERGREMPSADGPMRGRSTSPVRPSSQTSGETPVMAPAPTVGHSPRQAAERANAKSEGPSESERALMDMSRELSRAQNELMQTKESLEHRVQEAFERGLSEGERLAGENRRQEAEAYAYGLEKLSQLGRALETLARHEALELALLIARRIMQKEVEISPAFLVETIKRTASQLLGRAEMKIRLNPADLDVVRAIAPELTQSFPAVALVTLFGDEALERGDCIIDTDVEHINLTLNEQLSALKDALTGAIA